MGFLNLLFFFISLSIFLISIALSDDDNVPPPAPQPPGINNAFKPSIAIIVGILTTIFSITFLLLLYFKHCKSGIYSNTSRGHPPTRINSGINRKVIESLPLFRFSSLRGQKDGLECAVCLNRFEPDEVLRLLPKCKHAFHVECVDTWLDGHSTCPLCRYRVDAEDVLLVDGKSLYNDQSTPRSSDGKLRGAARVSGRHSYAGGERGGNLEIIVENPGQDLRGRVSLDSWSSRRKAENSRKSKDSRKDGELPVKEDKHRLEHRIIISGEAAEEEEGQRRWSDAEASGLLFLRSEMILEEEGSGRGVINERSVSEITGVSRYRSNNGRKREKDERERQEEGVVKRWLAWISQQKQQKTAVESATSSSSSPPAIVV